MIKAFEVSILREFYFSLTWHGMYFHLYNVYVYLLFSWSVIQKHKYLRIDIRYVLTKLLLKTCINIKTWYIRGVKLRKEP